jgi:hypothetical protein
MHAVHAVPGDSMANKLQCAVCVPTRHQSMDSSCIELLRGREILRRGEATLENDDVQVNANLMLAQCIGCCSFG